MWRDALTMTNFVEFYLTVITTFTSLIEEFG